MAATKRPVDLDIAGKQFRVVSSADADSLQRLAKAVESKLQELAPGQLNHPQAFLLVALALAHDLENARSENEALRESQLQAVRGMLERVDDALEHVDENGLPLPDARCGHSV